jgi:DNA-binding CsgD family transcriptional regulator
MNITDQLIIQREMELLQLLFIGLTYEKIANRMNVSHETIKKYLKNIYGS